MCGRSHWTWPYCRICWSIRKTAYLSRSATCRSLSMTAYNWWSIRGTILLSKSVTPLSLYFPPLATSIRSSNHLWWIWYLSFYHQGYPGSPTPCFCYHKVCPTSLNQTVCRLESNKLSLRLTIRYWNWPSKSESLLWPSALPWTILASPRGELFTSTSSDVPRSRLFQGFKYVPVSRQNLQ